jgi:hypothetical protein
MTPTSGAVPRAGRRRFRLMWGARRTASSPRRRGTHEAIAIPGSEDAA